jgi:hypothetical protein
VRKGRRDLPCRANRNRDGKRVGDALYRARGLAIIPGVQRQPLRSKAVISAGYDEAARELELEFRSGHVYRYENVPASVYAWLLRIQNKGGFVRRMSHGHYVERAVCAAERAAYAPAAEGAGQGEARGGAAGVAPLEGSLEDTLRASLERLAKPPA